MYLLTCLPGWTTEKRDLDVTTGVGIYIYYIYMNNFKNRLNNLLDPFTEVKFY